MKINSTQNFHLTHKKRNYTSQFSESGVCAREMKHSVPANIQNISEKNYEPAKISFRGFFNAKKIAWLIKAQNTLISIGEDNLSDAQKVFNKDSFAKLFGVVENTVSVKLPENSNIKVKQKKIAKFLSEAIDFIQNPNKSVDEEVKNFLKKDSNKKIINTVIEQSKQLIKKADAKNKLSEKGILKATKELTMDALGIAHAVENPGKLYGSELYGSKIFAKFIHLAENSQAVFSATIAAVLACFLRPTAIIALPGEKKNRDDQKYAAAHSIASGFLGYVVAMVVNAPISKALDKIIQTNDSQVKYLGGKLKEDLKINKKIAIKYTNMIPEVVLAIPKAAITIALIPPILKYVFRMEKKSAHNKQENINSIVQNYSMLNFQSSKIKKRKAFQAFTGESR